MPKNAIVASLLIIVAFVAGAWFLVQQQKMETPGNQTLKQEEVTKKDSIVDPYPQHIEVISGTSEVWYNIPEFGVRMKLSREFAGELIYSFVHEKNTHNEEWDTVYFSTKSLVTIDNGCSPIDGHPLGAMLKTQGKEVSTKNQTGYYESAYFGQLIFQFPDYFISWQGPQATCWNPKNDKTIEKVRGPEVYKNFREGFKTLQEIPSK